MSRINISITNEKTIERLQRLSAQMDDASYATVVAVTVAEYENAHGGKKGKV